MKIAFNNLVVEITRKCQLQCAHCMRGDAQNINIDNKTITTLLNKTSDIERLTFTGGEPTLNIDGMKFFLDTMIKNDIHLSKLEIVTNGVLLSEQFIELLKRYYDWIDKSNTPYKIYIHLGISEDKYHQGINVEKAVNFYKEHLNDYPKIRIHTHRVADTFVKPLGRAKNLNTMDTVQNEIYKFQNIKRKTRIEVMTKNNKTFCPLRKFEEVKDNEARILCSIMITAKGDITSFEELEYDEEDTPGNRICNVKDNILWQISLYNLRLPHCIEFDMLKQSIIKKNSKAYSLKKSFEIFLNQGNTIDILAAKEKWNKYVDEINEYYNNSGYDEISFEPTDQDYIDVYEELIELNKKGATHYLKEKNHRQPTDEEIQNEIFKLYRGYERTLNTQHLEDLTQNIQSTFYRMVNLILNTRN